MYIKRVIPAFNSLYFVWYTFPPR